MDYIIRKYYKKNMACLNISCMKLYLCLSMAAPPNQSQKQLIAGVFNSLGKKMIGLVAEVDSKVVRLSGSVLWTGRLWTCK